MWKAFFYFGIIDMLPFQPHPFFPPTLHLKTSSPPLHIVPNVSTAFPISCNGRQTFVVPVGFIDNWTKKVKVALPGMTNICTERHNNYIKIYWTNKKLCQPFFLFPALPGRSNGLSVDAHSFLNNSSVLSWSEVLRKIQTMHLRSWIVMPKYVNAIYEGWNFNSGNYLFTTDTK